MNKNGKCRMVKVYNRFFGCQILKIIFKERLSYKTGIKLEF